MLKSAFVGVSLDSTLFTREWVRHAMAQILSAHEDVSFVLGDGLLAYNKTVCSSADGLLQLNLKDGAEKRKKRATDIYKFLSAEVARLPIMLRSRITISHWDDYADAAFVNIHRTLLIAYLSIPAFHDCVARDVEAHLLHQIKARYPIEVHRRLCALYVVEETAMIIRITESGKPYEYYPQNHIETLTSLYREEFAEFGLTVDSLVGHPNSRIFTCLPPVSGISRGHRI